MHTVLWITCLLHLVGGRCRGGEKSEEQRSNLLHNLLVPWGRRLTPGEGPWCIVHGPGAGSWGLPHFLSCSLKCPEVGEIIPDPGVVLWGCPPQSLFPKCLFPSIFMSPGVYECVEKSSRMTTAFKLHYNSLICCHPCWLLQSACCRHFWTLLCFLMISRLLA